MPGFGPLEMTEELRRHIAQLLGDQVAAKDAGAPPSPPAEAQEQRASIEKSTVSKPVDTDASAQPRVPDAEPGTSPAPSPQPASQRNEVDISLQGEAERRSSTASITKKSHGRALPK